MTLIERLEAAEAGSRELDAEINLTIRVPDWRNKKYPQWADSIGAKWSVLFYDDGGNGMSIPPVTTSLDAALALAERVLPGWLTWRIESEGVSFTAAFWDDPEYDSVGVGRAPTPALALCIAILKAKEAEK